MTAILSDCGTYRYRLERDLGFLTGSTLAFIMVNPSTADAERDDATIRKVKGFAVRHGARRIIVANLFAYRATDIKALRVAPDPVGPLGDHHLHRAIDEADRVIVAWGPAAKLPKRLRSRWREAAGHAQARGISLYCLGVAQDGHPKHPLMLGYDSPLELWPGLPPYSSPLRAAGRLLDGVTHDARPEVRHVG
jgi:hypothetical protein